MAFTFSKLATVTVGSGGSASFSFTDIPQNYKDLFIKICARSATSAANDGALCGINGNIWTSNFSGKLLRGTGSATLSADAPYFFAGYMPAATATASTFGSNDIYISNYASSSYKSISLDSVQENNTTAAVQQMNAMLWSNVTAITSLKFTTDSTANFAQYSTATLYGIRAEV